MLDTDVGAIENSENGAIENRFKSLCLKLLEHNNIFTVSEEHSNG